MFFSQEAEKLYLLTYKKFTPLEADNATSDRNSSDIIRGTKLPDLSHEIELWKKGYVVIGIDEVGRGAFAGPLYVAGVVFAQATNNKRINYLISLGINDSKKLRSNQRKLLSKIIQKESLAYYIGSIDVAQINRVGIGKATFTAMRNVVKRLRENLSEKKNFVLVDGFYIKYLKSLGLKNQKKIVHGDKISLSIAAASIIAKVARDKHMKELSAKFPAYGWGKNKGYGTAEHQRALLKFGKTKFHRLDFIERFV